MPNRIIKESVCVSEQIDELAPFEEVFFYRLLVNCDDYGVMDARVKVLSAKLFPLRSIKPSEIERTLRKLEKTDLILLYEIDGQPYLKVKKWSDHQRVRVSKHKYPVPDDKNVLAASCGDSRQVAANCGEMRPDARAHRIQSESESKKESESESNARGRAESNLPGIKSQFDRFWEAYPRKEGKESARKIFAKLDPDEGLLQRILAAIEKQKKSQQWQEKGGQFIPYPATWLNGKRWEDEVKPASGPSKAAEYEQRDYSGGDLMSFDDVLAEIARRTSV